MSRTSKPNSKVLDLETRRNQTGNIFLKVLRMNIVELIAFVILCATYLAAMYIMIRGDK